MIRPSLASTLASGLFVASLSSTAIAQSHVAEPSPQHAETDGLEHHEHGVHRGPHHRYQLGLAGTLLVGLTERGPALRRGGGVSFAVSIVSHLEIESIVHAVIAEENGFQFPIDLVLKKAFVLTDWLHPFVGVGPTLVPFVLPERSGALYGLATVAGVDLWINHETGVTIELSYNLLHSADVPVEDVVIEKAELV